MVKQGSNQCSAYKVRLKNNDEGMKTYKTKWKHGDALADYFESVKYLQPIACNKVDDIVLLPGWLSKIITVM